MTTLFDSNMSDQEIADKLGVPVRVVRESRRDHVAVKEAAVSELLTCEECGNMGTSDSWPFVQRRELVVDGVTLWGILCDDCWDDCLNQEDIDRA